MTRVALERQVLILVQRCYTPDQLDVMKNPPWIPHPAKKTFMSRSQQTYCQYVARLWHLYFVLPESSTLISSFEIQQRMWTHVTLRDDCIRLSAGREMNICHKVWSLSTVMHPLTVYDKHKELLKSSCWELKENTTYITDPAHLTMNSGANEGTLGRSPMLQQEECRNLISAMTIVKTVPRWDKCIMVLWDYVEK